MARLTVLTLLALSLALPSAQAEISPKYPPDFSHQVVRVLHEGPALFAYVANGYMSSFVIGYKNAGTLVQEANAAPKYIDAHVQVHCTQADGTSAEKDSLIRLGREWHETGYMSVPLRYLDFQPSSCAGQELNHIQVLFVDDQGHWDTHGAQDYLLNWQQLATSHRLFETHEGGLQINLPAWDFIISEMKIKN